MLKVFKKASNFRGLELSVLIILSQFSFSACTDKQKAQLPKQIANATLPPGADQRQGGGAGGNGRLPVVDLLRAETAIGSKQGACAQLTSLQGNFARSMDRRDPLNPRPAIGNRWELESGVTQTECRVLFDWNTYSNSSSENWRFRNVREALQACNDAGPCYLRMGLKADFRSSQAVRMTVNHAEPFAVDVYAVDTSVTPFQVYILDGRNLSFEIDNSTSESTFVERADQNQSSLNGWFQASFVPQEENGALPESLPSDTARIRLAQIQRDLQIANSPEAAPYVNVLARPSPRFAKDAFSQMSLQLVDQNQELPRYATVLGGVNVATGEYSRTDLDTLLPIPSTSLNLDISRTYRSFYASVEDFGYNFASFPKLKFYSYSESPNELGQNQVAPFLFTGEGRVLYAPHYDCTFDQIASVRLGTTRRCRSEEAENAFGFFWGASPEFLKTSLRRAKILHGIERQLFDRNGLWFGDTDKDAGFRSRYNLYDGTEIVIMMDHEAVSANSASQIENAISIFKTALSNVGSNALAITPEIQMQIQNSFDKAIAGNFLYLLRNQKGYVIAVIDRLGNMMRYVYDLDGSGDRLISVERVVNHNPTGSLQMRNDSLSQYEYAYNEAAADSAITEKALLKSVVTQSAPEAVSDISFQLNEAQYGPFLVVQSIESNSGQQKLNFNYATDTLQDQGFSTSVTDNLSRNFNYAFDNIGFVNRVTGPTESTNLSVIQERVLDRKIFRVVNSIVRNQESLFEYSSEGELLSASQCADRNISSQEEVIAQTAFQTESGEIAGLSCDASVTPRTTRYSAQKTHIRDWFIDGSGTPVPLEVQLPTTALNAYKTQTKSLGQETGFFVGNNPQQRLIWGLAGTSEFLVGQHPAVESGSFISWLQTPGSSGTNPAHFHPVIKGRSAYLDGSTKSEVDNVTELATEPETSELIDFGIDDAEAQRLAYFSTVPQRGKFVEVPSLGVTSVASPEGTKNLSASTTKSVVGIYGEVLASQSAAPFYAITLNFYDYRGISPVLVNSKLIRIFPTGGRAVTDWNMADAGQAALAFINFHFPDGDQNQYLLDAMRTQVFSSEAKKQWLFNSDQEQNSGLNASPSLKTTKVLNSSGVSSYHQYDSKGRPILSSEYASKDIHGTPINLSWKIRSYDDDTGRLLRVSESSLDSSAEVSSTIVYRNNFDRGASGTRSDARELGGVQTEEIVTAYDLAGRVLEKTQSVLSGSERSFGPQLITESYEYSPFGEVISTQTVKASLDSSNGVTRVDVERDLSTGLVIRTTTQETGAEDFSSEAQEIEYEYDDFLQVKKLRDVIRNIETSYSGVPGKEQTISVTAPPTYRSSGQRLMSQRTEKYDGCGNTIELRVSQSEDSERDLIKRNQIAYGSGRCLLAKEVSTTGVETRIGYLSNAEAMVADKRSNVDVVFGSGDLQVSRTRFNCVLDSDGRCNIDDRSMSLFSLNLAGSPGEDQVGRSWDLIVHSGSLTRMSGAGIALETSEFLSGGRRLRTQATQEDVFRSTTTVNGRGESQVTELPFQTLSSQTANYAASTGQNDILVNNQTRTSMDPLNGIERESYEARLDPLTNTYSQSLKRTLSATLNGSIKSSEHFVASSQSIPEQSATLTAAAQLLSRTEVLAWNRGKAEHIRTLNQFSTGSVQEDVKIKKFFNEADIPSEIETTRQYGNQYSAKGLSEISEFDGLGIPKVQSYAADHSADLDLLKIKTTVTQQNNLAQKIDSETVLVQDFDGNSVNQTIALNPPLSRKILQSPQQLQVNYEYLQNELVMNYDGFQVRYEIHPLTGQIKRVIATTPDGRTHVFNAYDSVDVNYPFQAQTDRQQGRIQGAHRGWFERLIGLPADSLILSNQEFPPTCSAAVGIFACSTDSAFRTYSADLSRSQFTHIHQSDSSQGYPISEQLRLGQGEASILRSRTAREGRESLASRLSSCDGMNSYQVGSMESRFPQIHSRWTAQRPNAADWRLSDQANAFDEMGRPIWLRRTHYENMNQANEATWQLDSKNYYDGRGDLVGYEGSISYRHLGLAGAFGGTQVRPMRAILSRYFNVAAPLDIFGGNSSLALKEVTIDRIVKTGDDPSRGFGTPESREGTYYYVYGPRQQPIWAFKKVGSTWKRFDFIAEAQGNTSRYFQYQKRSDGSIVPPTQLEVYSPYLSSVVIKYSGLQTVTDGLGKVKRWQYGSDGSRDLRLSSDPTVLPLASPYGGAGFRRDPLLGSLYLKGLVYDTFTGEFIRQRKDDDSVCSGMGNFVAQAQAYFDAQRMAEDQARPQVSALYKQRTAEELASFEESAPWYYRTLNGEVSLAAEVRFAGQRGADWYLTENYSAGEISLSSISGAVCMNSLWSSIEKAGRPSVDGVLSAAGCVTSFLSGPAGLMLKVPGALGATAAAVTAVDNVAGFLGMAVGFMQDPEDEE